MIKNNRGQLSIFMGITLILVMSLLAFVINVGLFVKAKINLQNSVDAAAYAGAAVQARQLSNIAYLNWEMRNTFKEWMFKYYVLGQLGLMTNDYNLSPGKLNSGDQTKFFLKTPSAEVAGTAGVGFDKYNAPSICIHNNSLTNICPIATLPGIPRFPAIGVAGISEIHEAFVNELVKEKGANCSDRTQINFLAAMSWAYSSGIRDIPGAPLVATNRPGAWPQALELGMRMRNLEMIVNRAPVTTPMDLAAVNALASQAPQIGLNERPVKAFMSAFRNMSGGKYKSNDGGSSKDEFASSFKLVELAPQPFAAAAVPVSAFLIPSTATLALQKHYLDLQAVPLNYATMFTTFATTSNQFEPGIESEAACNVSKTAMPVPGYILGFVKNPSVLTYYAVKGEAEFTGLFFPRNSDDQPRSIKLTAYAAAKPFGGRIGPRLFDFKDNSSVIARGDTSKRSASYFSAFKIPAAALSGFEPGMPIPASQDFWADPEIPGTNVGGVPLVGDNVKYGLPNLIYDFDDFSDLQYQATDTALLPLTLIKERAETLSTSERVGLYHTKQFKMLRANLEVGAGGTMTGDQVMKALVKARGVTKYDALNYLIPDHRTQPNNDDNIVPVIKEMPGLVQGGVGVNYALFAPLIGDDLLYGNTDDIVKIVNEYIEANKSAVEIYLTSLLQVGERIFAMPSQGGSSVNALAAQSIHANAGTGGGPIPAFLNSGGDPNNALAPSCKRDMASKFNHFFRAPNTQCGIVPLEVLMKEFISKQTVDDGKMYYKTTYYNYMEPGKAMTAFYPGRRQDVSVDGTARVTHPITRAQEYSARRNTYSTKFFNMAKVMENAPGETNKGDFDGEIFKEDGRDPPLDMAGVNVINPLKFDAASGLNNKFYLDF